MSSLQKRVNQYFSERTLSKSGNSSIILKSATAFALYLFPFAAILLWPQAPLGLLFGLWLLMGVGKAFVGMAVMHDSLHEALSKKRKINRLFGFSTLLLGISGRNWRIQHNVLHHTFTNIDGADEDIAPRKMFRFSPDQKRKSAHRFQHLYALPIYALSTLSWVSVKDFRKAFQYREYGFVRDGADLRKHLLGIALAKLLYFSIFLVLPILILPYSAWMVVVMFVAMHLVAGLLITVVFQCAHIVPSSHFAPVEEGANADHNWVHQLKTTANFGQNNRLLTWFTGGLNHQIEHHLFPNISHVHYRSLGAIVRQTAAEYNIPYHAQPTLARAIYNHLKMLKLLGQGAI